jgi:hypothetical protein
MTIKKDEKKIETQITYVGIDKLSVVWAQSQRPYNEKWAKEIGAEFDPDKFDPPVITKPNGIGYYHVVEGQHRIKGAEMALGTNQLIPCRIVDAEDPARAAEIWLGINAGRKATKPVQDFLISVTANREPETEINKLVNTLGYHISQTKKDYGISAVSSLKNVHKRFGKPVLHATLLALSKTWDGDSTAFGGDLIKGYATFINEWKSMEPRRLIEALKNGPRGVAATPYQLITAGKAYADQMQLSLSEAISEELRRRYNKNLKEENKLKRK